MRTNGHSWWEYLSPLNALRFFGIFISISMALMFNLNWILHVPFHAWVFPVAFALSCFVFRYVGMPVVFLKDNWDLYAFLLFIVLLVMLGVYSFAGRLDEPQYKTPDPAFHYMYMTDGSVTGFMPQFVKGKIYGDSGNNISFLNHQERYFPGSIALFTFLSDGLPFLKSIVVLQVFNIVAYVLVVSYFAYLFLQMESGSNLWLLIPAVILLGIGSTFNFLQTSFSTQLFGLYVLLLAFDLLFLFRNRLIGWFLPALSLTAVLLTYFYWIPVVVFFVGVLFIPHVFNRLRIREYSAVLMTIADLSKIAFLTALFGIGYLWFIIDVQYLSQSTAEGGFSFYGEFIDSFILLVPIVVVYLVHSVKNRKIDLSTSAAIASLIYWAVLYLAYLGKYSSKYAFMKDYYLLLPLFTIVLIRFASLAYNLYKEEGISGMFRNGYVRTAILLSCAAGAYVYPDGLSLYTRNMDILTASKANKPQFTVEQQELLDRIKTKHSNLLENGRMFIIAPLQSALWAYSYSGIWPRTPSLLHSEDSGNRSDSSMGFFLSADYEQWLTNDKNHVLAFFDTGESDSWIKSNGFSFDDYDVVERVGRNILLKLKDRRTAVFDLPEPSAESDDKTAQVLPADVEFVAGRNRLIGISVNATIHQKRLSGKYIFDLYEGACSSTVKMVDESVVESDSLRIKKNKDTIDIPLEKRIDDSEGRRYCLKVTNSEGDSDALQIRKKLSTQKYLYVSKVGL